MYKEKFYKITSLYQKIKLKKKTSYRGNSQELHIAGITQNKQKSLIVIVVPQVRKNFSYIRSNRRKFNIKKWINEKK